MLIILIWDKMQLLPIHFIKNNFIFHGAFQTTFGQNCPNSLIDDFIYHKCIRDHILADIQLRNRITCNEGTTGDRERIRGVPAPNRTILPNKEAVEAEEVLQGREEISRRTREYNFS